MLLFCGRLMLLDDFVFVLLLLCFNLCLVFGMVDWCGCFWLFVLLRALVVMLGVVFDCLCFGCLFMFDLCLLGYLFWLFRWIVCCDCLLFVV